uniref:Uncharacterized protein n=1 Tax=Angiostrongylus cantonensis TaxID=6313 RepID=A0A0K0DMR7_ANGCA
MSTHFRSLKNVAKMFSIVSFFICFQFQRKNDGSTTERNLANKQLANEKPVCLTNPRYVLIFSKKFRLLRDAFQNEESGKSEQNSERTDKNKECSVIFIQPLYPICEVYMSNLDTILETANNYMWAMKKHMAADHAAWKELAKRITLLRAEVMITSSVFTIFFEQVFDLYKSLLDVLIC